MAARFTKAYNREIYNTVRNFNARLARLQRSIDYEGVQLPSRVYVSQIKAQAANKRELDKILRSLQRFGRSGATDIVSTASGDRLEYELREIKLRASQSKSYLTRQIKFYQTAKVTLGAETQLSTLAEMDVTGYRELQARRDALSVNLKSLTDDELEAFNDLLKNNSATVNIKKMVQFQNNMIKALAGKNRHSSEAQALDMIVEKLGNLSPREFWYRYKLSPEFQELWESYYKTERTETGEVLTTLHAADDKDFQRKLNTVLSNQYSIFEKPFF